MEFKCVNDKTTTTTPQSKPKAFSSTTNCERFFNMPSSICTPPSRFSKIINPFECRLLDKLHLPTFSPSVFATQSTPKNDEHFKWTIDELSNLNPANIDEDTVSQHIHDDDPQVESLVQQKINEFFSEKVIVPSPMINLEKARLFNGNPSFLPKEPKELSDGSTQTTLSLPPTLPPHIEEILKPYFLPDDKFMNTNASEMKNTSLFQHLFKNFESPKSFPDNSDFQPHLSLEEFSPIKPTVQLTRRQSFHFENPDLHECSLSPIQGISASTGSLKQSRSVVRLDFSSKMSLDASMAVPDIGNELSNVSELLDSSQYCPRSLNLLSESPVNWEMENGHVSLISPPSSPDSTRMDVSNANTPRSKLFTSQRKRLSHSFIGEDDSKKDNELLVENNKQGRRLFKNDITDAGYHTESTTFYDESRRSTHMFASTPTKTQKEKQQH